MSVVGAYSQLWCLPRAFSCRWGYIGSSSTIILTAPQNGYPIKAFKEEGGFCEDNEHLAEQEVCFRQRWEFHLE